jgi:hypothetical protein
VRCAAGAAGLLAPIRRSVEPEPAVEQEAASQLDSFLMSLAVCTVPSLSSY